MRILISNDDGISSPGIEALVKALHREHTLVVAAPAAQQSAMSHAITVRQRLYVDEYAPLQEKYGVEALAISGTPADTVKLYIEGICPATKAPKPDLIISGINDGANVGTDLLYSGTVGAAAEGAVQGIKALAVSRDYGSQLSFDYIAEALAEKLSDLVNIGFTSENDKHNTSVPDTGNPDSPCHRSPDYGKVLNINFPKSLKADSQWLWCIQGILNYSNAYTPERDEAGRLYYTVGGEPLNEGNGAFTDAIVLAQGNITATLLQLDKTSYGGWQPGTPLKF